MRDSNWAHGRRALAVPLAFAIGALSPLIGANLLRFEDIETVEAGLASIGGAATSRSSMIAAYPA